MTLPLAIWTTGAPVPQAEKTRGNFFEMIKLGVADGFLGQFVEVDCISRTEYPAPQEFSGIIVSGSPARLIDQEPWMLRAEEELRRAHLLNIPILGICFGHQLLGEALGGKVGPNPAGREIGTKRLQSIGEDPLLDGIEAPPLVVMTHLDSVLEAPQGARATRASDVEPHAALRFSETTWGVQFHPEMDAEIIAHYLEARRGEIESEGMHVDDLLKNRKDSPWGRLLLGRFGRFCATSAFES